MSRARRPGPCSVSKINRHLRESGRTKRVGAGAPVYLAAVLEYAAAEIIELAGNALEGKRKRITPQDIMKAIRGDEELNKLLAGSTVFVGDRVMDVTQGGHGRPRRPRPRRGGARTVCAR